MSEEPIVKTSDDYFDDVSYELELETTPELLALAEEINGETEEARRTMPQQLREMISERPDITLYRTDDEFFLRFLRKKDFNLKKAYDQLLSYCKFRENHPEVYKGLDPFGLRFLGDGDVIQVTPYREQTGKRICFYKVGNWDMSKYHIDTLIQGTYIMLEVGLLEPKFHIVGGLAVIDLQGISLNFLSHVTPSFLIKLFYLGVASVPFKIRAIHVIFGSRVWSILYHLIKPILTEKIKSRIIFHGNDVKSLHKHIDPYYLPRRYGGIRPEYHYDKWIDNLIWRDDLIKELEILGYSINHKEIEAWRARIQNPAKEKKV